MVGIRSYHLRASWRPGDPLKIMLGGRSGGKTQLASARRSLRPLAWASVRAAQSLYGRYRDLLVVHGKEKVYGSIP